MGAGVDTDRHDALSGDVSSDEAINTNSDLAPPWGVGLFEMDADLGVGHV